MKFHRKLLKKLTLLFVYFIFSSQIIKAQSPIYYFFDKKNNTKELIHFFEIGTGTVIMEKIPNETKWAEVKILKNQGFGKTYTVQLADKLKYEITPVPQTPLLKIKNLKTGITRNFEQKTFYLSKNDNSEYLEFQMTDKNYKSLNKPIWIWVSKNSTKTFTTKIYDEINQIYTLSLPGEKGNYTLKMSPENFLDKELTTPNGIKKIFSLENVIFE